MAGPAVPARRGQEGVDVPRLARLFHALSDETRLKVIGKLLHGEQCVCNLMDTLEAAQSRLSFHMKTLKDASLVTDRRAGRWIYYSLNPETLAELQNFLGTIHENAVKMEASKCCEEEKAPLGQLYGFSLF